MYSLEAYLKWLLYRFKVDFDGWNFVLEIFEVPGVDFKQT